MWACATSLDSISIYKSKHLTNLLANSIICRFSSFQELRTARIPPFEQIIWFIYYTNNPPRIDSHFQAVPLCLFFLGDFHMKFLTHAPTPKNRKKKTERNKRKGSGKSWPLLSFEEDNTMCLVAIRISAICRLFCFVANQITNQSKHYLLNLLLNMVVLRRLLCRLLCRFVRSLIVSDVSKFLG